MTEIFPTGFESLVSTAPLRFVTAAGLLLDVVLKLSSLNKAFNEYLTANEVLSEALTFTVQSKSEEERRRLFEKVVVGRSGRSTCSAQALAAVQGQKSDPEKDKKGVFQSPHFIRNFVSRLVGTEAEELNGANFRLEPLPYGRFLYGTAVALVSKHGDALFLQELIRLGAQVTSQTPPYRLTPLHFAAREGHGDACALLLWAGADCDPETVYRFTPLHLASEFGQLAVVELLLDNGADIEALTKDQRTPFHLSLQGKHEGVAMVLVNRGADCETEDSHDRRPLLAALHYGYANLAKTLIDKGADLNASNRDGQLPVHVAALHGLTEVVEHILRASSGDSDREDASPVSGAVLLQMEDLQGHTALHLAALKGHEETVRVLLKRGASVQTESRDLSLPLHLAAREGRVGTVSLLLEAGAEKAARDAQGRTPKDLAEQHGHDEAASLL